MKTKSLILSGLLLATIGLSTTSCEDMFTKESDLNTTELAPEDSIYRVMGIVKQMQKLVDRTILLGEARADLVDITSATTTTLQDVAANTIGKDNSYNNVADYYAVINSCNIYIENVDTAYRVHNKQFFIKEFAAVKAFRAWTYLQLVLNYGNVPFVTHGVLSAADAADIAAQTTNRADLQAICDYFIEDLTPLINQELPPYSSQMGGHNPIKFFIPIRLILGDLYLWRGSLNNNESDFLNAAVCYHDYLDYSGKYIPTELLARVRWDNSQFKGNPSGRYAEQFTSNSDEIITLIPLDTLTTGTEKDVYDANVSELGGIFCSLYKNNYKVQLTASPRLKEISRSQEYCYYVSSDIASLRDTVYSSEAAFEDELLEGDLRLQSVFNVKTVLDKYHAEYSSERQAIEKFGKNNRGATNDKRIEFVPLYRVGMVYLRLAEALNRAGFPETAFGILKYGISSTTMSNHVSSVEVDRLREVATQFDGNLASWNPYQFITYDGAGAQNQIGIHSRGCGDSEYNALYVLPSDQEIDAQLDAYALDSTSTAADTLAYDSAYASVQEQQRVARIPKVEEMILDEMALEGMFEGYRFYDLMRVALRRNDPSFLATKVAQRKGEEEEDAALKSRLSTQANWYLPLP